MGLAARLVLSNLFLDCKTSRMHFPAVVHMSRWKEDGRMQFAAIPTKSGFAPGVKSFSSPRAGICSLSSMLFGDTLILNIE